MVRSGGDITSRPRLAMGSALLGLMCVGVIACIVIISNAPSAPEVELDDALDALETSGPYHNSYIKPPSMQQLVGHDSNPNDNSLRLHLLSKFVQKKMQRMHPQKEQLNGLWQRLAYARKVLGSDADEILGPQRRDANGNRLARHHNNGEQANFAPHDDTQQLSEEQNTDEDDARSSNSNEDNNSFMAHLRAQKLAQEELDETQPHTSRSRQLTRLRRLMKSKFHLANKAEALAIAEQNARSNSVHHNSFAEQRRSDQAAARRIINTNNNNQLSRHPGAERALDAVDPQAAQQDQPQQQLQQQQPTVAAAKMTPLHHVVKDDSTEKLVIEGGPLSANSGPVAVVGWLHKAPDGDWAGKLFPKNTAQGLAAMRSPQAGGLGWFDGTVTAAQLRQQAAPAPVVAAAPEPVSEVPEEQSEPSDELTQPFYSSQPTYYSSASLDPQLNTPINQFEIEPGLQLN